MKLVYVLYVKLIRSINTTLDIALNHMNEDYDNYCKGQEIERKYRCVFNKTCFCSKFL